MECDCLHCIACAIVAPHGRAVLVAVVAVPDVLEKMHLQQGQNVFIRPRCLSQVHLQYTGCKPAASAAELPLSAS